jgi:hypothetical protein
MKFYGSQIDRSNCEKSNRENISGGQATLMNLCGSIFEQLFEGNSLSAIDPAQRLN